VTGERVATSRVLSLSVKPVMVAECFLRL